MFGKPRQDDIDTLDRALDSLAVGDGSRLDALPSDMAETAFRLHWLQREGTAPVAEPRQATSDAGPPQAPTDSRPTAMPVMERETTGGRVRTWRFPDPVVRVLAASIAVLVVAGMVWGLILLTGEEGGSPDFGAGETNLETVLMPDMCPPTAVTREDALAVLRDVDPTRDVALITDLRWEARDDRVPFDELAPVFRSWQACRRFGSTYQAMALQDPHYTREDFYGERDLAFHGPVETAYDDGVLAAMLDAREDADATSRRYWSEIGREPRDVEVLVLGEEAYFTGRDERVYFAIRLGRDAGEDNFFPDSRMVVFVNDGAGWKIFDIISVLPGRVPYSQIAIAPAAIDPVVRRTGREGSRA